MLTCMTSFMVQTIKSMQWFHNSININIYVTSRNHLAKSTNVLQLETNNNVEKVCPTIFCSNFPRTLKKNPNEVVKSQLTK